MRTLNEISIAINGLQLEAARKERGWSQECLAIVTNKEISSIDLYECQSRVCVNLSFLVKLCQVFDKNVMFFQESMDAEQGKKQESKAS